MCYNLFIFIAVIYFTFAILKPFENEFFLEYFSLLVFPFIIIFNGRYKYEGDICCVQ